MEDDGRELEVPAPRRIGDDILDVDQPDHVVQGAAVDRHAGVIGFVEGLQQAIQVALNLDGNNVGPRHHDIVGGDMPLLQQVGQHDALFIADRRGGGLFRLAFADLLDDLFDRLAQGAFAVTAAQAVAQRPPQGTPPTGAGALAVGAAGPCAAQAAAHVGAVSWRGGGSADSWP